MSEDKKEVPLSEVSAGTEEEAFEQAREAVLAGKVSG